MSLADEQRHRGVLNSLLELQHLNRTVVKNTLDACRDDPETLSIVLCVIMNKQANQFSSPYNDLLCHAGTTQRTVDVYNVFLRRAYRNRATIPSSIFQAALLCRNYAMAHLYAPVHLTQALDDQYHDYRCLWSFIDSETKHSAMGVGLSTLLMGIGQNRNMAQIAERFVNNNYSIEEDLPADAFAALWVLTKHKYLAPLAAVVRWVGNVDDLSTLCKATSIRTLPEGFHYVGSNAAFFWSTYRYSMDDCYNMLADKHIDAQHLHTIVCESRHNRHNLRCALLVCQTLSNRCDLYNALADLSIDDTDSENIARFEDVVLQMVSGKFASFHTLFTIFDNNKTMFTKDDKKKILLVRQMSAVCNSQELLSFVRRIAPNILRDLHNYPDLFTWLKTSNRRSEIINVFTSAYTMSTKEYADLVCPTAAASPVPFYAECPSARLFLYILYGSHKGNRRPPNAMDGQPTFVPEEHLTEALLKQLTVIGRWQNGLPQPATKRLLNIILPFDHPACKVAGLFKKCVAACISDVESLVRLREAYGSEWPSVFAMHKCALSTRFPGFALSSAISERDSTTIKSLLSEHDYALPHLELAFQLATKHRVTLAFEDEPKLRRAGVTCYLYLDKCSRLRHDIDIDTLCDDFGCVVANMCHRKTLAVRNLFIWISRALRRDHFLFVSYAWALLKTLYRVARDENGDTWASLRNVASLMLDARDVYKDLLIDTFRDHPKLVSALDDARFLKACMYAPLRISDLSNLSCQRRFRQIIEQCDRDSPDNIRLAHLRSWAQAWSLNWAALSPQTQTTVRRLCSKNYTLLPDAEAIANIVPLDMSAMLSVTYTPLEVLSLEPYVDRNVFRAHVERHFLGQPDKLLTLKTSHFLRALCAMRTSADDRREIFQRLVKKRRTAEMLHMVKMDPSLLEDVNSSQDSENCDSSDSSQDEDNNRPQCAICLGDRPRWMHKECGHLCYCDDCHTHTSKTTKCPLCAKKSPQMKVFY